MPEEPRFRFAADPAQSRYGPVVYGLKALVDGISRSTGLGTSQVVVGLLFAAGLSLAIVVGGAVVIARDTGPAKPEPVSDYVPGGPPPPDRAVINAAAHPPSPAPTDVLGDRYQEEEPRSIPLSSFLNFDRRTAGQEPAPPVTQDLQDPDGEDASPMAQTGDRSSRPAPRPWQLKEMEHKEMFGGTNPSNQRSIVQQEVKEPRPGSTQGGALSRSAAERAGNLAGQLPSVPDIAGGVVLGGEAAPARDPRKRPGTRDTRRPKSDGSADGPIVQEKMPDVGPGKQLNDVQSGPGPAGKSRIAPAGEQMLSVPIDVNRIQLEADKAHDVDRSPGLHVIGQ